MKRRIYFRADADWQTGYGHFIRTLALADMLKDEFDCVFVTCNPTEYQKNECSKVCRLVALEGDDSRFEAFLQMLRGDETVVLDNYFFSTEYQKQIKTKGCSLVCLDGMTDKHYVADVLVCQSLGLSRADFSLESYTRLYTGLGYALLRRPFLEAVRTERSGAEGLRAVVSFGGADKFNLTGRIIDALCPLKQISSITAITGDAYSSGTVNNAKVEYLHNLSASRIAEILTDADLAILPSSSILKEAIACGTQCITGYFVDNQILSYNSFVAANLAVGVGDFTTDDSVDKVIEHINGGSFRNADPAAAGIDASIPSKYIEIFKSL